MAEPDLDALERAADGALPGFTEAVLASGNWRGALRALFARPGFAARALALLERADVAAARPLPDRVRNVVEALGQALGYAAYAPAFDLLAALHRGHPDRTVRVYVGHGLFGYGARGLDALAGPPGSEPDDVEPIVRLLRVKAALMRGDGFDALAQGSVEKRAAVLDALAHDAAFREPVTRAPRPEHDFIGREPRWLEWVARALLEPALHDAAETVLFYVPRATWQPVVDRVKKLAPAAPPRVRPPTKAAIARLDAELRALRASLEAIVTELRAQGFAFVGAPLEPPMPACAAALAKLEQRVGAVPLSLARFWTVVGAVDLRGNHPRWARPTWLRTRADEPVWSADPLVVTSLAGALAEAHDADFDAADALPGAFYRLVVAGDATSSANYSGGQYAVRCGAPMLDAELEPTGRTFLGRLRDAVHWGGFPGFAAIAERPPGYPRAASPGPADRARSTRSRPRLPRAR